MLEFVNSKRLLEYMVFFGVVQPNRASKSSGQAYNTSRQVRAGARKIMTAAERQAFLKNSEYGRMAGVAEK